MLLCHRNTEAFNHTTQSIRDDKWRLTQHCFQFWHLFGKSKAWKRIYLTIFRVLSSVSRFRIDPPKILRICSLFFNFKLEREKERRMMCLVWQMERWLVGLSNVDKRPQPHYFIELSLVWSIERSEKIRFEIWLINCFLLTTRNSFLSTLWLPSVSNMLNAISNPDLGSETAENHLLEKRLAKQRRENKRSNLTRQNR